MRSLLDRLALADHPLSRGHSTEVAHEVIAHPELIDEIFDGIASDDEGLSNRSVYALEKISAARPELLTPYKREILTRVVQIERWAARSHVCKILPRLTTLTASERRRLIALAESFLASKSSIVKATGLDCLVQLSIAARSEEARTYAAQLVAASIAHGDTPALRARARLLQKQLAKLAPRHGASST